MGRGRSGLTSSSSDILHTKIDATRNGLLTSGLYLGDQIFKIDKMIWWHIGTDNCLVTKESADAVDTAHAAMMPQKHLGMIIYFHPSQNMTWQSFLQLSTSVMTTSG